ncbi:hypothetical protein QYM36_017572 [Artemia franciscana]|uniref:Uncharacterized protein n=1 Tax=Artemia franciscana TaxID=6661 RepID=A0AA88HBS3_ARTSF|nr:hypothetical protein QYM36_017572 [Artemia franciscana]
MRERALISKVLQEEIVLGALKIGPNSQIAIKADIISKIFDSICEVSQHEPVGLRGFVIFFHLKSVTKSEKSDELVKIIYDDYNVSSFEVLETVPWSFLVPQFLRSLIGALNPMVISEDYILSVRKLF